jgi:NAD(P)-dependent dehydrogenase (short-subunit alcohol dehydrogenase family)
MATRLCAISWFLVDADADNVRFGVATAGIQAQHKSSLAQGGSFVNSVETRVALITGGGSGIGRACAEVFALQGARVMVADISETTGRETVRQIRDGGGVAEFVQVDVAQASEAESMVQATLDAFGPLDIVLANAGYGGPFEPFLDQSEEETLHLISVNLYGVVHTCRSAIPRIRAHAGGSVVITSSICGLSGVAGLGIYGATNWGAIGLTQTLALECAPSGVRVNAVAPGYIDTPMNAADLERTPELRTYYETVTPLGRMGTAHDVARAVAFLCSEDASWITGITLVVDGGVLLRQSDVVLGQKMLG